MPKRIPLLSCRGALLLAASMLPAGALAQTRPVLLPLPGHGARMEGVAIGPGGRLLAAGGRSQAITLWDLPAARPHLLKTPCLQTGSLALTPDGGTLFTLGAAPGGLFVWDVAGGALRRLVPQGQVCHVRYATLSHSGQVLMTPGALWTTTGDRVAGFRHGDPMPGISPDGRALACYGPDGSDAGALDGVRLVDPTTGQVLRLLQTLRFRNTGVGANRLTGVGVDSLTGRVECCTFSPTGNLAAGMLGGTLAIWAGAAGEPFWVEHAGFERDEGFWPLPPVAFSPDGQVVAIPGMQTITLRDVATLEVRGLLRGHFPGDARPAGKQCLPFSGIWGLSYSQDGRLLASASHDGSVRLWDPLAGREVAAFLTLDEGDNWLVVTPQGYYAGTLDGPAVVGWRLRGALFPVETFTARLHRPDLVRCILRGEAVPQDAPRPPDDVRPPLVTLETPSAEKMDIGTSRPVVVVPGDSMPVRITVRPGGTGAAIRKVELRVNGRPVEGERLQDVKATAYGEGVVSKPRQEPAEGKAGDAPPAVAAKDGLDILGLQPVVEAIETEDARARGVVVTATVRLLPGEGALQLLACAWDEQEVRGTSMPVAMGRKDAPGQAGDLYVLAVGLNEAAGAGPALIFADADARAVEAALKEQEGKAFARVHTRLLANGEATQAALLAGAKWLQEEPKANDVALLFVSGHALLDDEDRPHLLTADARAPAILAEGKPDAAAAPDTAEEGQPGPRLPLWPQISTALRRCKARQVAAFLDCYRATTPGDRVTVPDALAGPLVLDAGAATLLACRWHEGSAEVPMAKHGAFAAALLEGLAAAAADKKTRRVTLGRLQSYVAERVPRLAGGRQHPWAPRSALFDTGLVLAELPPPDQKAVQ